MDNKSITKTWETTWLVFSRQKKRAAGRYFKRRLAGVVGKMKGGCETLWTLFPPPPPPSIYNWCGRMFRLIVTVLLLGLALSSCLKNWRKRLQRYKGRIWWDFALPSVSGERSRPKRTQTYRIKELWRSIEEIESRSGGLGRKTGKRPWKNYQIHGQQSQQDTK